VNAFFHDSIFPRSSPAAMVRFCEFLSLSAILPGDKSGSGAGRKPLEVFPT
jgi:hypothetical protein